MSFDNPFAPPASTEREGHASQPLSSQGILASRADRLAAQMLDGLVLIPSIVVGAVILAISMDPDSTLAMVGFSIAALLMLGTFIYQWYLISTTGQSLGKRWMNIKILRQDGSEVGFVHGVLIRVWVMQMLGGIPLIGSFISLADILFIFGEPRRCLHDHLASTEVINIKARA